jgi:hypothetical protein
MVFAPYTFHSFECFRGKAVFILKSIISWDVTLCEWSVYSSILKIEAICLSETAVNLYQKTWRHIPLHTSSTIASICITIIWFQAIMYALGKKCSSWRVCICSLVSEHRRNCCSTGALFPGPSLQGHTLMSAHLAACLFDACNCWPSKT